MAKLSSYEISGMKERILKDLYGAELEKLTVRKTDIAKRNRQLWLDKYQHLLDQLPESMVTRHAHYYVSIKYTPEIDKSKILIDEKWEYLTESSVPVINPVDMNTSGYVRAADGNALHPNLETETDILCKAILKIRKEKGAMKEYLNETTTMFTGSIGLRKAWDPALHKYLPPEPIKAKKSKKSDEKIVPAAPTFMKVRMTNNLLEEQ